MTLTSQPFDAAPARPRRRWRTWIGIAVAVVLLAVLAVGGLSWWRVQQTFDEVNSVPPLPSVVSGAALGGDSELSIDTGPAQAAIATAEAQRELGELSLFPTPTPFTNQSSPVASPALSSLVPVSRSYQRLNFVQATTPAADEAASTPANQPVTTSEPASPTPTPLLSEIDRVRNGGFEDENAEWYRDPEAGVSAAAGLAHSGDFSLQFAAGEGYADQDIATFAGNEYQLAFWAISPNGAQPFAFGVHYYDADYQRQESLEPAPGSAILATSYQQITFTFTPPETVVYVKSFFYAEAATGIIAVDDVSARAVLPADLLIRPSNLIQDEATTILVMGVDARPGEQIDVGVRPDSLMVVRLDPEQGTCRVLAIPRDSRVELPGYGLSKINHALAVGGIPYQQLVVEQFLGIAIDHYVLVDFAGFKELVDSIGGITVDIPEGFTASDGLVFAPGVQTLNGTQALSYSRYRGGSDGDFGRIERQQQLLRAMLDKAGDLNMYEAVTELMPQLGDRLRTDLDENAITSLARQYGDTCTDDTVEFFHLEGSIATFDDPLLGIPLSYVVIDEADVRRNIAQLLGPS